MRNLKIEFFRLALWVWDLCAMIFAGWGAYALFFEGEIPRTFAMQQRLLVPVWISAVMALFSYFGVYSRRMGFFTEEDYKRLALSVIGGVALSYGFVKIYAQPYWIYWILFCFFVFVSRGGIGVYAGYRRYFFPLWQIILIPLLVSAFGVVIVSLRGNILDFPVSYAPISKVIHILFVALALCALTGVRWFFNAVIFRGFRKQRATRALLIGSENETALRMLVNLLKQHYDIPAILHRNPAHIGWKIEGIRIIGKPDIVDVAVREYRPEMILIASDSGLTQSDVSRVEAYCRENRTRLSHIGGWHEYLMLGDSFSTADLIDREEYRFNPPARENYLYDQRVLVSGAGGSIGSELVRQILRYQPRTVYLLGRGENAIYRLEQELLTANPQAPIVPVIANVADYEALRAVFERYPVDIVFHAAAHKHVPLMEEHVAEAVRNNVWGSWNIADLSGKYGAKHYVQISTDKAVNPSSVMGASKRRAEQVVAFCSKEHPNTHYTVVRFGNVLGSRGSVVERFMEQIRKGGPLTVTDPRMTRYFMTIPEAVALVLSTPVLDARFGIYILNMGRPYRITELAERMICMCGLIPGKDIQIIYTGVRPGEKLDEELFASGETVVKTANAHILRIQGDQPILDPRAIPVLSNADEAQLRTWLFSG